MNTQKGFSTILGILLVLAVIGGGAYAYTKGDIKGIFKKEETIVENSIATTTAQKEDIKKEISIKATTGTEAKSDPWEDFDVTYTNDYYGFSFKHPSATRLLVDFKNDGADPFIIKVEKKGSWSSLDMNDREEYPIPRMLKIADEKKFLINNLSVTRTTFDPDSSYYSGYITYDFVISGKSFVFSGYIDDSGSEKEVSDFIEELIKTFDKK